MAISASSGAKLMITNKENAEFKLTKALKQEYVFAEKAVEDPQASQNMEMEIPEFEEDWSSVNFTATGLFKRTELESNQLVMTLKMGNVIIDCKPQLLFDTDPEPDMKAMADLDFINRKTFQLIQTI